MFSAIGRVWKGGEGRGVAGSLALHGLAALILLFWIRSGVNAPPPSPPLIPVDIVQLGAQTTAVPQAARAPVPEQRASRGQSTSPVPQGVAPRKTRPMEDALDAKLRALAHLRQPDAPEQPIENDGLAEQNAGSDAPAGEAMYALRDFVRAQIERRWSLDASAVGNIAVRLHLSMKRDGTITAVQIVDAQRFASDKAFHEAALRARNAAILSSPIALPPGRYDAIMDFTLTLDPRAVMR